MAIVSFVLALAGPVLVLGLAHFKALTRENWRSLLFSPKKPAIAICVLVPLSILGIWFLRGGNTQPVVLLQLYLMVLFGYTAAFTDFTEKIVPNRLVVTMLLAWVVTMVPLVVSDFSQAFALGTSALLGLLAGGGIFFLVYLISKKGLGAGDVKFMAAVGLFATVYRIFTVMLYGTLLAAVVGVVLLLAKRISRKDSITLVPFLQVGVLLAALFV